MFVKGDFDQLGGVFLVYLGISQRRLNVLAIPATEIAADIGDVRVANVVMLGAYNRRRQIVPDDLLFDQVSYALRGLKGRLLELNRAAYARGAENAG